LSPPVTQSIVDEYRFRVQKKKKKKKGSHGRVAVMMVERVGSSKIPERRTLVEFKTKVDFTSEERGLYSWEVGIREKNGGGQ